LLREIRLQVRDVVEDHAGDGEGLQVLDGGGFVEVAAGGGGRGGEQEGEEAGGFCLEGANGGEELYPLLKGFVGAEDISAVEGMPAR